MVRGVLLFCSVFVLCQHVCDVDAHAASCNRAFDGASVEQAEKGEREAARLHLLQSRPIIPLEEESLHHAFEAPNRYEHEPRRGRFELGESSEALVLASRERLRASVPLAWTHIPKCGTSFANSLVRLPGLCPGVPADDTVYGPYSLDSVKFEARYPDWPERCPGLKPLEKRPSFGSHTNVGSLFETTYAGHGVIMLRQPEQKLISMYKYADHIPTLATEVQRSGINVTDFAKLAAGCAVRMLTKQGSAVKDFAWSDCMGVDRVLQPIQSMEVSMSDVIEAKKRLHGYAFVGITDKWSLSICLLHVMFGGMCQPAEFVNVRTQRSSSTEGYDTSVLQGFVDQYDGALYEEALLIFAESLRRYNVSKASCQQCFESGGTEVTRDSS